jgi:hypothetical protein
MPSTPSRRPSARIVSVSRPSATASAASTLDPTMGALIGAPAEVAADADALVNTPNGLWASTFGGTAALVDPGAGRVLRRVRLPGRGSGIAYGGGRVWVSV